MSMENISEMPVKYLIRGSVRTLTESGLKLREAHRSADPDGRDIDGG